MVQSMYDVPPTATMRHPLAETKCVGRVSSSPSSPQSAVKRLLPVDAPVGRSASARSRQLRWSASSGGASSASASGVSATSSSSSAGAEVVSSAGGGAASRPRPKNRENAMAKRGRLVWCASILGVVAARSVERLVARDEVARRARRGVGGPRALDATRTLEEAHDLEGDGAQEGDLARVRGGAEGQRA